MPGNIGNNPVVVSPPNVLYEVDQLWPQTLVRRSLGDPFEPDGMQRYGGAKIANLWSAAAGAGVNTMGQTARLAPCGQFVSDGIGGVVSRSVDTFSIQGPIKTLAGSTIKYPTWVRAWRWQFTMRLTAAANVTYKTFAALVPCDAGVPVLPDVGGTFFGIIGDGGGNWEFAARQTVKVGLDLTVPLPTVPMPVTTEATYDLVVLAANLITGEPGHVKGYVNGVQYVDLLFDFNPFPLYTAVANGMQFVPVVGARDPAVAATLQIGAMRLCAGLYDANGVPVGGP